MSNWNRKATQLLDLARDGHEPTAHDAARVHRLLKARLWADPTLFAAATTQAAGMTAGVPLLKLLTVVCIGGAAGLGVGIGFIAPASRAPAPASSPMVSAAPRAATERREPAATTLRDSASRELSAAATPERKPALRNEAASAAAAQNVNPSPAENLLPEEKSSPATLALELKSLREAQELLHRGDAIGALRALDRIQQTAPVGALHEERDATATLARCKLGREPARALARFAADYPASVHLNPVRAVCALGQDDLRAARPTESASSPH